MTRKIAIITGGSRGLGANAALKLATRNTDLIITYKQNKAAPMRSFPILPSWVNEQLHCILMPALF